MMDYGANGEIFIYYWSKGIIEIWDWMPPTSENPDEDTLYLLYQVNVPEAENVHGFKIHNQGPFDKYRVLIIRSDEEIYKLESYCLSPDKGQGFGVITPQSTVDLPCHLTNDVSKFFIKVAKNFVVIANNLGHLHLFRQLKDKSLCGANVGNQLHTIRKTCCQPILNTDLTLSKLPQVDVALRTSCNVDGTPIFDIVENWLVYSPVKTEYTYMRAIIGTTLKPVACPELIDPLITNTKRSTNESEKVKVSRSKMLFTPVRLPPPGPLLNRVLSTFSNTTLDGLFKLSEMSSSKVIAYLNKSKKSQTDHDNNSNTINSLGKSMGKLLFSTVSSTANTLHSSTKGLKPHNNQIIKVLDLSNDKVLGIFKPPGGVSTLSLSPYDLQLVHVNDRGDSLFMWDLYRLPTEISLVGKFTRGKTSAIIEEIFWFNNAYDIRNSSDSKSAHGTTYCKGNNSGFGCISKVSGSVHWFNTNYLTGDNNYPKSFGEGVKTSEFLDSWILSTLKAKKFVALPCNSNVTSSKKGSNEVTTENNSRNVISQLAIIDEKNQLKLISSWNGCNFYKYDLPKVPVDSKDIPKYNTRKARKQEKEITIPLSQAEIETSGPVLNLINNRNIQFETYDFQGDDVKGFLSVFEEFGNEIPVNTIHFGPKTKKGERRRSKSEEDLLNEGLYMEQEVEKID